MQSVGEVMAIGRTFTESLQKGFRSLENGRLGLNSDPAEKSFDEMSNESLCEAAKVATPDRLFQVEALLRRGLSLEEVNFATSIDPWFLDQILSITEERSNLETKDFNTLGKREWKRAKQLGFSDAQLSYLWGIEESLIRQKRESLGVFPTYKTVDTCGAEFEANTPYHYSTWEDEDEVKKSDKPKIMILGSGPNRIGQGIEFDYCCVHASFALRSAGYETIMVNCNPETVSTDYDTSDRLYFEPLTKEDVVNIIQTENPEGIIVSLGGQTPLKLASVLPEELIAGTNPRSIDIAEDRELWNALCREIGINQPPGGTAVDLNEAEKIADEVGFPVLVRPSYVLGGRAMEIVYDHSQLGKAMAELLEFGSLGIEGGLSAERPVLVDRFLEEAIEVDVDAIRDKTGEKVIGAVMEHVEEAGIHSGDSACVIPPPHLTEDVIARIEQFTFQIADALEVQGLINVQFAVKENEIYVIEANPRASRTVPFVAKATGVPLAKVASRVMVGATLSELREEGLLRDRVVGDHVAVKEAVLPFNRFPEADPVLGPEMRSTGEVMGIDLTTGLAFAKSQISAGGALPETGTVFMSLADRDKETGLQAACSLSELGLEIVATRGTAEYLEKNGVKVKEVVAKLDEEGTDAVELIRSGRIQLVVNSPHGRGPRADGDYIRGAAGAQDIPLLTTAAAALAAAKGLHEWKNSSLEVRTLQTYHKGVKADK
tara:strand:- start:2415 stop:4562 length:2148 start_codon:yes stop_codon:yes gene_type:complete